MQILDSRAAELWQADRHFDVAFFWLVTVGAEHPVPAGKVEAEITISFPTNDRMMNPVHVGRHEEQAKDTIEPQR